MGVSSAFGGAAGGVHYRDMPKIEDSVLLLENEKALGWTYLPFERNYDGWTMYDFGRNNYWLGPTAAALYCLFIWLGPKYMRDKKAFELRLALKFWNLFLAIFSTWGALRTVPHLLVFLWRYGYEPTICSSPFFTFGRGGAGFWTMLFIYSKFFELIDTVFIVLRKRKLSFLHWYHHASVLLYTWDAFITAAPPGLYFCAMNYSVHAVMYLYYFLAAHMKRPPRWSLFVTLSQIAQMLAGVYVTLSSLRYSLKYPSAFIFTREAAIDPIGVQGVCYLNKVNITAAIGMYSTYFYLFAEFFVKRYLLGSKTKIQ